MLKLVLPNLPFILHPSSFEPTSIKIYHMTVVLSPLMVSTNSSCWPLSAGLRAVSCFPPKPIHFNRSNSSANNFQFINSSSQIESDIRTAEGWLLPSIFKIPVLVLPIDSISLTHIHFMVMNKYISSSSFGSTDSISLIKLSSKGKEVA